MKLFISIEFIFLFFPIVCLHTSADNQMLWPVNGQNHVAYIDQNGDRQFHIDGVEGSIFYHGLATVERDAKYGVVDRSGSFILDVEYASIDRLDTNLYLASKQNDTGKYFWMIIAIKDKKEFFNLSVDNAKAYLPSGNPDYLYVWRDSDFVIMHVKTRDILFQGQLSFLYPMKDGIAPGINSEGEACYVDLDMRKVEVIDDVRQVVSYSGGVFSALSHRGKWGLIDKHGEWIVLPEYHHIKDSTSGLLAAQLSPIPPRWTYIGIDGSKIGFMYADAGNFVDGLAPAAVSIENEEKWGYVNSSGDFVIEPKYDIALEFKGKLAQVVLDDKVHYINTEGHVVFVEEEERKGSGVVFEEEHPG